MSSTSERADELGGQEHRIPEQTGRGRGPEEQRAPEQTGRERGPEEQRAPERGPEEQRAPERGPAEQPAPEHGPAEQRAAEQRGPEHGPEEQRVPEQGGPEQHTGGTDHGRTATLIDPAKAGDYRRRWNDLKGDFVDDPQHAVRGIDGLVGDVLDELEQTFRAQRSNLERGLHDRASTEDLRIAFSKYREFFDRLLSF
jgi:hypothetical protein